MDKQGLHCAEVLKTLAGQEVHLPADTLAHVSVVALDKDEVLFEMGQPHPYLYVLRQGCVKLIYRTEQGEEWVQDFMAEGDLGLRGQDDLILCAAPFGGGVDMEASHEGPGAFAERPGLIRTVGGGMDGPDGGRLGVLKE